MAKNFEISNSQYIVRVELYKYSKEWDEVERRYWYTDTNYDERYLFIDLSDEKSNLDIDFTLLTEVISFLSNDLPGWSELQVYKLFYGEWEHIKTEIL